MIHNDIQQILNEMESGESKDFDGNAKIALIKSIGVLDNEIERLNEYSYQIANAIVEAGSFVGKSVQARGGG